MIKKLFILVFWALPLSLAAQNLKFGTVNTVDVFNLMPEKATAEKQLEDLSKQYESEFMKMQEEFTTKYKDFVNSQDSMPENIKQRRMQEIQEIQQRIQNFREVATGDRSGKRFYLYFRYEHSFRALCRRSGCRCHPVGKSQVGLVIPAGICGV